MPTTSQSKQNPTAGIFLSSSANLIAAISGLIVTVLLARKFGASGIGIYFFYLVIGQTISRIPDGIGSAIRQKIRETELDQSEYYGASLFLSIFIVFLTGLTVIIAVTIMPYELGFQFSQHLFLGTIAVTSGMSVFRLMHNAYTATNDSSWLKILRYSSILIAQVALLSKGFGIPSLLFAYGIISFVSGVLITGTATGFGAPSGRVLSGIFKRSLKTVPTSIVSNFHHKLDVLVLGIILGFNSIGLYEAALRLTLPAMIAATTISSFMSVNLRGADSKYKAVELVRTATTYSTVVAFPLLAILVAIGSETIWFLFTPSFHAEWGLLTWEVLALLAVTQLVVSFSTPLNMALRSMKKGKKVLAIRAGALLVNAPLSVYLTIRFGILGAVGATLFVEVLSTLLYYTLVRLQIQNALQVGELVKQLLSALIIGVLLYLIGTQGLLTTPTRVLAVALVGTALYFVIYISISYQTKQQVLKIVR